MCWIWKNWFLWATLTPTTINFQLKVEFGEFTKALLLWWKKEVKTLYILLGSIVTSVVVVWLSEDPYLNTTRLWHMWLGHMAERLHALSKQCLLYGQKTQKFNFCEHCVFDKQHKSFFLVQCSQDKRHIGLQPFKCLGSLLGSIERWSILSLWLMIIPKKFICILSNIRAMCLLPSSSRRLCSNSKQQRRWSALVPTTEWSFVSLSLNSSAKIKELWGIIQFITQHNIMEL